MSSPVFNIQALEPLFGPSDIPDKHRAQGAPSNIAQGRRPSKIAIAQNLRVALSDWRASDYSGASDTTRALLHYWFSQDHEVNTPAGEVVPFSYYFCQREAIESLIYLFEVLEKRALSAFTAEFGGQDKERAALGIDPNEDLWPKYAFKIATGAGKTKIMTLAIAWSYFHALRESDSPLARHFVIIAPGITVFERLKEDFGDGRIFDRDPVIPPEWRGDWNVSVVLQDEPSGASTGGTIYLSNIHRLYDLQKRSRKEADTYDWTGPPVSKAKALDTSKALRERIMSHRRIMVLNDEAHHVWDPDSAWNEAIGFLHSATASRGGGLVAQLDFSATPKDNAGNVFKHVVCDTPLGEAVDAGIVKTPVIGSGGTLHSGPSPDAGYKYEQHLMLGYKRWLVSKEEWERSGKKTILFVMTESTKAADEIARRLNADPIFGELNGKTLNLHTNLKGKLKKVGRGQSAYDVFVESEKEISDEDLMALRRLSRELDENSSPYRCIVSVLMLREGWDIRNVTTIIPLRPLTAKSKILPEQTLGRGLRRITPPGSESAAEVVVVVEHGAFLDLYRDELSQEGLDIPIVNVDDVPRTTVTIYPDAAKKDLAALDLLIPRLSQAYQIRSELGDLSFDEIKDSFRVFKALPLGKPEPRDVQYEGRHLITNEVVEQMKVSLPILQDAMGAVSFFREELERTSKIRGTHAKLAPLIQRFLEEVLFGKKVDLYDPAVTPRLADFDVREHVRATFLPVILRKIVNRRERLPEASPQTVCAWRPFQVTHSEHHPAEPAKRTPFNLVPCNRGLEVAMAHFLDQAPDVVAFAKNAGPQALRVDYLALGGRRSIYTPDFLVRRTDKNYLLVETKGRADRDASRRARAAVEWCKAASIKGSRWEYVFVPQDVFERLSGNTIDELTRACAPPLAGLLRELDSPQFELILDQPPTSEQVREFIEPAAFEQLPPRYRKAIEQAVSLFRFHEKKTQVSFAPVFTPLLGPIDHAAEALLLGRLLKNVPSSEPDRKIYFEPDLSSAKKSSVDFLTERARTLKRLLVHRSPLMPTGILTFCLDYASSEGEPPPGIFGSVRSQFADLARTKLKILAERVYQFRNTYIAHEKAELTSADEARAAMATWVETLALLSAALGEHEG